MGLAWWLVPTEIDSKFLSNAIQKASTQHSSPTFQPHVTLFSLPSPAASTTSAVTSNDKLIASTKSIVKKVVAPLTLEQDEVQVGETYHQSVFLKLKENESITRLRKDLLKAVGGPADLVSPDFPHASLYYGEGTADDKHHVVMYMMDSRAIDIHHDGKLEVSNIGPELHLDSVWIVDIISQDPSTWKVLHKEPLKEGKRVGSPLSVKSATSAKNDGTPEVVPVKSSEPASKGAPATVTEENGNGKAGSSKGTGSVAKVKRFFCF